MTCKAICIKPRIALAGEGWTVNLKVASSIPSQGTCMGCRPGSQPGVCERQLISLLSKNKLKKKIFKKIK